MRMNHQDHVDLLRNAIGTAGTRWADFGSGDGAFTLALRDLLGPAAEIFSIEKDRVRLDAQKRNFRSMFPQSSVQFIHADFTQSPPLRYGDALQSLNPSISSLDGIVMANSLHYFKDKEKILRHVRGFLKPNGALLLVEYNVDSGNLWVPHPFVRRGEHKGAFCP